MQPQDSGFDWWHIVSGAIGGLFGALVAIFKGIWRGARIEPNMRKEITQEIAEATHELAEKIDQGTSDFDETLKALRQKINDVELNTEKRFREYVDKEDFNRFRDEWREDMRRFEGNIAAMLRERS